MYTIIKTEGRAKRAMLKTCHGDIQTPVFMNVATAAAIKGAVSSLDLKEIGTMVALCNTYHLHLRPGDEVVRDAGGLRPFMAWDGPVLTDSGGFQVFSLTALRKITEEGVYFSSHIDGRKIFMGPEESINIQSNLGSTIAMAFDECAPYPADKNYILDSTARTTRWLIRCRDRMLEINEAKFNEAQINESQINKAKFNKAKFNGLQGRQMLFGINQGGTYADIRIDHAKEISELNLDGYAVGGLAVGESHEEMYRILEAVVPYLPQNKPTYLMGVGTPENILEGVDLGVDFFDCVLPARNGRHGHVFTSSGKINLYNARFERDQSPIDPLCGCSVCGTFSRAYIRHLFKAKEMLAMRLCVMHNLYFYNKLMADIRTALEEERFGQFKRERLAMWSESGI